MNLLSKSLALTLAAGGTNRAPTRKRHWTSVALQFRSGSLRPHEIRDLSRKRGLVFATIGLGISAFTTPVGALAA